MQDNHLDSKQTLSKAELQKIKKYKEQKLYVECVSEHYFTDFDQELEKCLIEFKLCR